eukprot:CAMPEP_0178986348 /NCGR_PEP_ID=MMETSP0795-20121207/2657_1 /TAXON_ID=88552 /ORGANISM="Amoebophrya sp., Strain Ameob2" /LENGTH=515 /DNA_ID=CAMNT_0020677405 /DNA_START=114 /DNA_END=1661 /DNA_ORIENTATION=+
MSASSSSCRALPQGNTAATTPTVSDLLVRSHGVSGFRGWVDAVRTQEEREREARVARLIVGAQVSMWQFGAARNLHTGTSWKKLPPAARLPNDVRLRIYEFLGPVDGFLPGFVSDLPHARELDRMLEQKRWAVCQRAAKYYVRLASEAACRGEDCLTITEETVARAPKFACGTAVAVEVAAASLESRGYVLQDSRGWTFHPHWPVMWQPPPGQRREDEEDWNDDGQDAVGNGDNVEAEEVWEGGDVGGGGDQPAGNEWENEDGADAAVEADENVNDEVVDAEIEVVAPSRMVFESGHFPLKLVFAKQRLPVLQAIAAFEMRDDIFLDAKQLAANNGMLQAALASAPGQRPADTFLKTFEKRSPLVEAFQRTLKAALRRATGYVEDLIRGAFADGNLHCVLTAQMWDAGPIRMPNGTAVAFFDHELVGEQSAFRIQDRAFLPGGGAARRAADGAHEHEGPRLPPHFCVMTLLTRKLGLEGVYASSTLLKDAFGNERERAFPVTFGIKALPAAKKDM